MEPLSKNTRMNVLLIMLALVTVAGAIFIHRHLAEIENTQREQRKGIVCPSLLSITRSSRDTLIVMKNEPLCAEFVLDSLQ